MTAERGGGVELQRGSAASQGLGVGKYRARTMEAKGGKVESQRGQKFHQCRYKWLIKPLIHRNAIASLDWIGKSAPVPLQSGPPETEFDTHTHTPTHARARTLTVPSHQAFRQAPFPEPAKGQTLLRHCAANSQHPCLDHSCEECQTTQDSYPRQDLE